MLAVSVTTILGSSILAFIMGVLIGVSLGYIIWSEKMIKRRGNNGIK